MNCIKSVTVIPIYKYSLAIMVKPKGTTRQEYENQMMVLPYNTRNLRTLRSLGGIDRASKGVGEAMFMGNVLRLCRDFHRKVTMKVQRSGKKTIKQHHAKTIYESEIMTNAPTRKSVTKQEYEDQMAVLPYNTRNLRVLRSLSDIDRASKGVGEALLVGSVLPACRDFHRRATMQVQRSGKKTIKQHHAIESSPRMIEL